MKGGPPKASMSVDLTTPSPSHLDELTNNQSGKEWGASHQAAIKPRSWTLHFPASSILFHPSLWQQGVRLLSRFVSEVVVSLNLAAGLTISDPE